MIWLAAFRNVQQSPQIGGAVEALIRGCFVARIFSHQRGSKSGIPHCGMKPAGDLPSMLPK
jgi:hypothetical protein